MITPDFLIKECASIGAKKTFDLLFDGIKELFGKGKMTEQVQTLLNQMAAFSARIDALEHDHLATLEELAARDAQIVELKTRLKENEQKLVKARATVVELTKRLEEKEEKRIEKEAAEKRRSDYELDERYGFVRSKKSGKPYCPICLRLMPPVEQSLPEGGRCEYSIHCPNCNREFHNPDYDPPFPRRGPQKW